MPRGPCQRQRAGRAWHRRRTLGSSSDPGHGSPVVRHGVAGVKLNRTGAHRRALFRNLVTALLEHEVVRTTDAKAKELRRWGDRLITLGKQGTLHARRRAAAIIHGHAVVKKLFDELGPRYQARQGGYTRVVKLGIRAGDAAPVSIVELVDR